MEINEIKEKAKFLKGAIELLLSQFREDTGYVPQVEIITKTKATNDGSFITQTVQITLTIQ